MKKIIIIITILLFSCSTTELVNFTKEAIKEYQNGEIVYEKTRVTFDTTYWQEETPNPFETWNIFKKDQNSEIKKGAFILKKNESNSEINYSVSINNLDFGDTIIKPKETIKISIAKKGIVEYQGLNKPELKIYNSQGFTIELLYSKELVKYKLYRVPIIYEIRKNKKLF